MSPHQGSRGQFLLAQKMVFSIITIFIIIVGIMIVLVVAASHKPDSSTTEELTAELRMRQLTNNPHCFAYQDFTGRVDQGIIVASPTSTALERCSIAGEPKKQLPVKITIFNRIDKTSIDIATTSWSGAMIGDALVVGSDGYMHLSGSIIPITIIVYLGGLSP